MKELQECPRNLWYATHGRILRAAGWRLRSEGPTWNAENALIERETGEALEHTGAHPEKITWSELWDFFAKEHDLHLLNSELNDIIHMVNRWRDSSEKDLSGGVESRHAGQSGSESTRKTDAAMKDNP